MSNHPARLDAPQFGSDSQVLTNVGMNTILTAPNSNYTFLIHQIRLQLLDDTTVAAAGLTDFTLYDGATVTNFVCSFYVPSGAGTQVGDQTCFLFPPGLTYLSNAAGNDIILNLSKALTGGGVRVVSYFSKANYIA